MATPTDENNKIDNEISMKDLEKEELLQKINYWENKYGEIEGKYNTLSQKYEDQEQKYATRENSSSKTSDSSEISEMKKQIALALKGLNSLATEVKSHSSSRNKERIDEYQQYNFRNTLLLHALRNIPPNTYGIDFIKYVVKEINTLFPNLAETVQLHHIDDAHILKTKKKSKIKVVIVKFSCRWIKSEIYKMRSNLKGIPCMSMFQ